MHPNMAQRWASRLAAPFEDFAFSIHALLQPLSSSSLPRAIQADRLLLGPSSVCTPCRRHLSVSSKVQVRDQPRPVSSQLPATPITTRISPPTHSSFHLVVVGRRVCPLPVVIHSVWVFAPSSTHPFASRSPFHSDSWLVPASAPPLRLADVAIVSLQILPSPSQTTFPPQRRLTLPSTKA